MEALLKEVTWVGERIDRKRPVVQLHLGGGTPTYNSPDSLKALIAHVRSIFTFDRDAEIGVEVDPRVTGPKHLKALRESGFNRISMGVQDFDPKVQKPINRIQSFEATRDLVQEARNMGYSSVNLDLIYGLPFQTVPSFLKTIEKILSIKPDRMAVYSYAHVPWLKKHQEILDPHLPTERDKFEIFRTALREFTRAGYEYIGMDHFARPNDELSQARRKRSLWRNFQGYTTKAGTDLFGMGMSAIGSVHGSYFQNQKELKEYQRVAGAGQAATTRGFHLTKDDKIRGRLIQNLLCHAEVFKADLEKEFGINFDQYFADSLDKLAEAQKDGLVELLADRIRPTAVGRIFLRNLAMPFDAHLPEAGDKPIFSRTV